MSQNDPDAKCMQQIKVDPQAKVGYTSGHNTGINVSGNYSSSEFIIDLISNHLSLLRKINQRNTSDGGTDLRRTKKVGLVALSRPEEPRGHSLFKGGGAFSLEVGFQCEYDRHN